MKRTLIISTCTLLLLFTFFLGCKKDATVDNKLYIRGRLFVTDSLILHQVNMPLGKQRVMLVDNLSPDTLNYIYSDTTDKDGYFIFTLFNKDIEKYRVRYSDSIGGYKYVGEVFNITPGTNGVVLVAHLDSSNLSGVQIISTDKQGGGIAAAAIAIYPSQGLAAVGDTTAATLTGRADSYGIFSTYQLKPGQYYVNSQKMVNNVLLKKVGEQLLVQKSQRAQATLVLTVADSSQLAGARVISSDSLGGAISKAEVTFYTSKVLANLSDPSGVVYHDNSNQYGELVTYSINPGTYYVNSRKAVDTMVFSTTAQQVILTKGQLTTANLTLYRTK